MVAEEPVKARARGASEPRSTWSPRTVLDRPRRFATAATDVDGTGAEDVVVVPESRAASGAMTIRSLVRAGGLADTVGTVEVVVVASLVDDGASVDAGATMAGSLV